MKDYLKDAVLHVEQDIEFVDRSLATASWWDKYTVHAGEYPVEWRNVGGSLYKAGNITPGFIADIGPDHGVFMVDATLTEMYREARLLSEIRPEHKTLNQQKSLALRAYSFQIYLGGQMYADPSVLMGTYGSLSASATQRAEAIEKIRTFV